MDDIIDTTQVLDAPQNTFGISIPKPFVLSEQDSGDLKKINDECMDKIKTWENNTTTLLSEYQIFSDSWRIKPSKPTGRKPNTLFNSKSGETHRATETLATFWLRALTAADPFHEAVAEGYDFDGRELTSQDLYAIENMTEKQLLWAHFKHKLLAILRSVANFGTVIAEKPFVSDKFRRREYTDLILRPLILTAFDTSVFDIEFSHYIATFDFPSKWMLRKWAQADDEFWDMEAVEKAIDENKNGQNANKFTNAWSRVQESKQRAGYTSLNENIFELIRYHGRIETDNSVVQRYWESEGLQEDPSDVDFSIGILNAQDTVSFHMTQYGNWRSRFAVADYKKFELEPYAYGVGKIGRKKQRELDVTESRSNDILMMALYSMWKVSKYAGLKTSQLTIKPQNVVELEDIAGLEPLRPDVQAIVMALNMMGVSKEDFRTMVGAATNLQAQITKASATESAIAQTEAIRGASVHAEIISETFIRDYIETIYLNDLNYLDEPIWVASTGEHKAAYYNRTNMPYGVGFKIKTVTDKDFRPERNQNLLRGIEVFSSVRQNFPPSLNPIPALTREFFRGMALNPSLLSEPMSMQDQMAMMMQLKAKQNQLPNMQNEMQGELASVNAPGNTNTEINTPVGVVPTSNIGASPEVSIA